MMNTMVLGAEVILKDSYSSTARQVSQSHDALQRSFEGTAQSAGQFGQKMETGVGGALTKVKKGGGGGGAGGIDGLKDSLVGLGGVFAGLKTIGAPFAAFEPPLADARAYGVEMGQIRTIIDEAAFSTDAVRDATFGLADAYGADAITSAKGLYEVISAGVMDATKATDLLGVANRFAVGGRAELGQAIDVLTSSVNAYAEQGLTAGHASDVLFTAIAAGKTTAAELSARMGEVIPTAQAAGISFEELGAAIAAMTVQGIRTPQAVTGLNAMISNLIKPSSDAAKESKRLGIEFNATALKTKGLNGVLDQLIGNTKVQDDTYGKLFGSIDGIKSALALTSGGGKKFDEVLGQITNTADATNAAFEIMTKTSDFQAKRFEALKKNASTLVGEALEPLKLKALEVGVSMLKAFNDLPAPVRDFLVRGVAMATTLATVVIGALTLASAIGALVAQVKTVAAAAGAASGAIAATGGAVVALGLIFAAFKVAADNDIGGVSQLFGGMVSKVWLAIQTLGQLFSTGAISGAVLDDVTKAENEGVLNFVTGIYLAVAKVQNFLEGLSTGFTDAIKVAEPYFEQFGASIRALGKEFDSLSAAIDPGAAKGEFDAAGESGRSVGQTLGQVATILVRALTAVIEVGIGVMRAWDRIKSSLTPIGEIFVEIGTDVGGLITTLSSLGDTGSETTAGFITLGQYLAGVFGAVLGFVRVNLNGIKNSIHAMVTAIGGAIDIIAGILTGDWARVWQGMKKVVYGVVSSVLSTIAGLVEGIAEAIDLAGSLVGKDLGLAKRVEGARASLDLSIKGGMGLEVAKAASAALPGGPVVPDFSAPATSLFATQAAVDAVGANNAGQASGLESLTSTMESIGQKLDKPRPINFNAKLNLDGKELKSELESVQSDEDDRSFK